ncbi:hypothetical protein PLICRDRAFT_105373 [Plicaturopsis crispa FD-325 SS-3]|nr:hypothetical protein PLICRDRAFT_105373 [Plicaturopsis crispa FD-325 SS-3]
MFKFDFDVEDEDSTGEGYAPAIYTPNPVPEGRPPVVLESFSEVHLAQLLDALPSLISYSPLSIPIANGRVLTLTRRDLFDARFQLISEGAGDTNEHTEGVPKDPKDAALAFLDAPSDLVPGVYEGGLKTWECSLDVVDYLDSIQDEIGSFRGRRVLELGCGTAVPSLYILHRLFSSEPDDVQETHIHLQDYNRSVLELVTVPNLILAWCINNTSRFPPDISPASAPYRASENLAEADPTQPSELQITPALTSAFVASLSAHRINIRLFSGAWDTFDLAVTGGPYDLVLTSETIYSSHALPALVTLLKAACNGSSLCLVAAKILYFGVGGGVSDFLRAVEDPRHLGTAGSVETVWEQQAGVARRVMRVRWPSC